MGVTCSNAYPYVSIVIQLELSLQ